MTKDDMEDGHFYKTPEQDFYIWIFVSFIDGNWIGKYGEDDSPAHVNGVYFNDHNYKREYEEVSTELPVFSEIGQFAVRNVFGEV